MLRIGGFVDTSTVDWYGNVSLVVFFAGCNFRCPYCQNSGLIPMDSGTEVGTDVLRERIEISRSLIDSVVFTGGEPLLQGGLLEASSVVKELGRELMIDTNGSVPRTLEPIIKSSLVDRVALDVKAPLKPSDYARTTGLENARAIVEGVTKTLRLCETHDIEIEARTTVAPTISDDANFIREIARDIRGRCDVYYLQQFDNTGEVLSPELKRMKPPTRKLMMELAAVALEEGVENVCIKTRKMGLERVR